MPKTIAICNQKGGVGKTTTTINLGAATALSGLSTLLVDLDPQANATGGLGIDKHSITQSIYHLLLEGLSAKSIIQKTKIQNLSILPSQVALSAADVELAGFSQREELLKASLLPIQDSFDLILIDCPPSLGLLTVNALTASDSVLIPLQCEYYALEGLSQLLETIRLVQEGLNPRLCVEGVLLTMADFRTKLTGDVIREVREFFGPKVYETIIPRSVRLSEAPSHGLPIALYDPHSVGAKGYQSLAEQLQKEIKSHARDTRIRQRDPGTDSGETPSCPGAQREASAAGDFPEPERVGQLGEDRSDQAQPIPTQTEPIQ